MKLTWKRAHRNSTNNLSWTSRCGRYRVEESARYIDINFESIQYKAWHITPQGWNQVGAKGWSEKLRIETRIVHFRTKAAAIAACDKHNQQETKHVRRTRRVAKRAPRDA